MEFQSTQSKQSIFVILDLIVSLWKTNNKDAKEEELVLFLFNIFKKTLELYLKGSLPGENNIKIDLEHFSLYFERACGKNIQKLTNFELNCMK